MRKKFFSLSFCSACDNYTGDNPGYIDCLDNRSSFLQSKIDTMVRTVSDMQQASNELNQICSEIQEITINCST